MRLPKYPSRVDASGRLRIKWKGRVYHLPKPINSPESIAVYRALIAQFAGSVGPRLAEQPDAVTVSQLIAKYLAAEPRGANHPHIQRIGRACVPLERMYGATIADEFTAAKLRAVQEAMISRSWQTDDERRDTLPWGRTHINQQIKRIRTVFRWGEESGLLRAGIWEHLRTLRCVPANRPGVKTSKPRESVDWTAQVEPILPLVSPVIAAVIQVQYLIGARPSEVLNMRRCEIDRHALPDVWLLRPGQHKGAGRGVELVKAIGPQAQMILAPWLLCCQSDDAPVFPVVPGGRAYTATGYAKAIKRACMKAGVKPFTAYALRHTRRRDVTRAFSLDHARAVLSHTSLAMSAEYSKCADVETAVIVARKIG